MIDEPDDQGLPEPPPDDGPGLFGDPAPAKPSPAPAKPYRVLARAYRPTRFDDLIGQDAMVRILRRAFALGRVAHAFMLTGVRGVGKTTSARIIARALNCVGADGTGGPTADPCGVCPNCVAILADRHPDVLEMDAASRTGIEDVREIIEATRFRPMQARMKVFIIDEVHMLSRNAFNALLKTLEEPPSQVTFIFATTELRKVPVTVLSRCQRFDLRRVSIGELGAHFARIAAREGAAISADALSLIARAADGSVRDGLSLLDQAIAQGPATGPAGGPETAPAGGGEIGAAQVADMLGLADRGLVFDLLDAVMEGRADAALRITDGAHERGADLGQMLQDLLELIHTVSRLKSIPALRTGSELPEAERVRGAALADALSVPVLGRAWQMLLKGVGEVETAPDRREAAEMVLIRLCHVADMPTPGELVRLIQAEGPNAVVPGAPPPGAGGSAATRAGDSAAEPAVLARHPETAGPGSGDGTGSPRVPHAPTASDESRTGAPQPAAGRSAPDPSVTPPWTTGNAVRTPPAGLSGDPEQPGSAREPAPAAGSGTATVSVDDSGPSRAEEPVSGDTSPGFATAGQPVSVSGAMSGDPAANAGPEGAGDASRHSAMGAVRDARGQPDATGHRSGDGPVAMGGGVPARTSGSGAVAAHSQAERSGSAEAADAPDTARTDHARGAGPAFASAGAGQAGAAGAEPADLRAERAEYAAPPAPLARHAPGLVENGADGSPPASYQQPVMRASGAEPVQGLSGGGALRAPALPEPELPDAGPDAPEPPPLLRSWREVVAFVNQRLPMLHGHLMHDAHLVRFRPPVIELSLERGAPPRLTQQLASVLSEATGTRWNIVISRDDPGEPTLAQQAGMVQADLDRDAEAHPLVRAILAAFPSASVGPVSDRSLDEYYALPPEQAESLLDEGAPPDMEFAPEGSEPVGLEDLSDR